MLNLFCIPLLSLNNILLCIFFNIYTDAHIRYLERLTCIVLVAVGWTILVCVGDASRTVWGACTTYTAGEIPLPKF